MVSSFSQKRFLFRRKTNKWLFLNIIRMNENLQKKQKKLKVNKFDREFNPLSKYLIFFSFLLSVLLNTLVS